MVVVLVSKVVPSVKALQAAPQQTRPHHMAATQVPEIDFHRWSGQLREAAFGEDATSITKLGSLLLEVQYMSSSCQALAAGLCKHMIDVETGSSCAPQLPITSLRLLALCREAFLGIDATWWMSLAKRWIQYGYTAYAECILQSVVDRGDAPAAVNHIAFEQFLSTALAAGKMDAANMLVKFDTFSNMYVPGEILLQACQSENGASSVQWLTALPTHQRPDINFDMGSPLRTACGQNRPGIVQALLAVPSPFAAEVGGEMAARAAAQAGAVPCLSQLLALEGGRRVDVDFCAGAIWLDACGASDNALECVQSLLSLPPERGLDVHARGDAALVYAVEENNAEVLHVLLSLTGDHALNVHLDDEEAVAAAVCLNAVACVRELLLAFSPTVANETDATKCINAALSRRFVIMLGCRVLHWTQLVAEAACSGPVVRCGQRLHSAISTAVQCLELDQRECLHREVGVHLWRGSGQLCQRPARRCLLLHRATAKACKRA